MEIKEKKGPIESSYVFDGAYRCVRNYNFAYRTYTKGRWLNRAIIEVFTEEYKAFTKEYYKNAIETGKITVNKKKVALDYILKNNDLILHDTERKELPVYNVDIPVVYEDEKLLVINKPASIPIHVCGAYNKNTILNILKEEKGYQNLHTLHRIDRVTSGVLLIGKKGSFAKKDLFFQEPTNRCNPI